MERITSRAFLGFLDKDTFRHFRLLFSFFLLPVYGFALSQALSWDWKNGVLVFFILHFFIYPGSNLYNSYMDKDKGSIGGLKNPPPVTGKLYIASIVMDCLGLLLGFFIDGVFVLYLLLYIAVSKAYSWRGIRLKRYALTGWVVVTLFQGGYTYMLTGMALEDNYGLSWFTARSVYAMFISSLLIGGIYPLTQIYQHQEDFVRGDFTISYKLGIFGTFIFSGAMLLLGILNMVVYLRLYFTNEQTYVFMFSILPAFLYFMDWAIKSFKDPLRADFTRSMRMLGLASFCMLVCFTILFVLNYGA